MKIYLDMDGVLADFFAEYAVLAGLPRGSSYRDIPPAKTDPTLNKMVGTDFFYRLPKFPSADKLVSIAVDAAGGYSICSSPLRGDHENSEIQKTRWIKENLNPQPEEIIITPQKQKYAKNPDGTPNVLIDDRGSNITAWEAAGGIAIKYQADEDSLKVVLDGLKRARRIGSGEEDHVPQQLKSIDRSKIISSPDDEKEVKEARKKKRKKPRAAAYGPGPHGGYGFVAGYSGGGSGGGDGGVGEASYPGNLGAMETFKFFNIASEEDKRKLKKLIAQGNKKLAWKLIQDVVGVKLQGKEFNENFADGKNPGRKGLAKRSGVDCKQSVTKLRQVAKSSSGEKQRMAHWCANMKSGKKK